MKALDALSDFSTPEEVGSVLRVSTDEVIQMLENGDLPGIKLGPVWRIPKNSLLDLLQAPPAIKYVKPRPRVNEVEIKIGELVRRTMDELLEKDLLPAYEIESLKSLDYSNQIFGLNFPFIKDYNPKNDLNSQRMVKSGQTEYPRYWKKIFADKFLITSEWNIRHKQKFLDWAGKFTRIS